MRYFKKGFKSDGRRLSTAKTPEKLALDNIRRSMLYYTNFRQNGELLNYIGFPGSVSGSSNINGQESNSFYAIFPVVKPPAGSKIRIGCYVRCWNYVSKTSPTMTILWNGSSIGQVSPITLSQRSTQLIDPSDPPDGITFFDWAEIDYNSNQSGDYGYVHLFFDNVSPASVTLFTMPLDFESFQSLDTQWAAQQDYLDDDAFNIGQTLRGCSELNDKNGSIGELCQRNGAIDDEEHNIVGSSARCLFQWGHPAGLGIAGASATPTYEDFFGGARMLVKGRDLRTENEFMEVDVIAFIRGDSGTQIRAASTVDSVTYTLSSTITSPTLVNVGKVRIASGGDSINFQGYVNNAAFLEIKTIAVFEPPNNF